MRGDVPQVRGESHQNFHGTLIEFSFIVIENSQVDTPKNTREYLVTIIYELYVLNLSF